MASILGGYRWTGSAWSLFYGAGDATTANSRSGLVAGAFFPTAQNTGTITPAALLAPVSGDVTYSTNNATITGKLFLGKVSVTGQNITFRDCWFRGSIDSTTAGPTVYQPDMVACTNANVLNLLFEDCTFDASYGAAGGPGSEDTYRTRFARNCIMGHHFTARRCRFAYGIDCIGVASVDASGARADVHLEGCWLSALTFYSPDSNSGNATHNDCIQWHGGKGLWLVGNRLEGFYNPAAGDSFDAWDGTKGNQYYPKQHSTSCLMFNKVSNRDAPGDMHITQNWINGGGAALVPSSSTSSFLADDGSEIRDNYFGWDYRNGVDFGVLAGASQVFALTGNTRWGATSWTHGSESDFETGVRDPFDRSVSFNVRKNG